MTKCNVEARKRNILPHLTLIFSLSNIAQSCLVLRQWSCSESVLRIMSKVIAFNSAEKKPKKVMGLQIEGKLSKFACIINFVSNIKTDPYEIYSSGS